MQDQSDDITVIQNILQGQPLAYTLLVDRYRSYVFTLALRYVGDRELAEELAQDVFVKAYRSLAGFNGHSKFSTWLYTITSNTCLSHLRKKKAPIVLLEEEYLKGLPADKERLLASDKLDTKDQQLFIERAMRHLAADEAYLLTLYYQAGQSVEEIGIIQGITATNVKVRLFRARQKLKEILVTKYSSELV